MSEKKRPGSASSMTAPPITEPRRSLTLVVEDSRQTTDAPSGEGTGYEACRDVSAPRYVESVVGEPPARGIEYTRDTPGQSSSPWTTTWAPVTSKARTRRRSSPSG